MSKERGPKLLSVKLNQIEKISESDLFLKMLGAKTVFIIKKGRVIAHAKWQEGDLIVTSIRRPKAAPNLKKGTVLYASYRPREIPPRPELISEGWQLIHHGRYDSSQAKRPDPYWHDYEGWFIIPETLMGRPALQDLLDDYPEIRGETTRSTIETISSRQVDVNELRMAPYAEIDRYVMGKTETIPELQPFFVPSTEDMVEMAPAVCYCGCGDFQGWYRYWTNKWIVYVPRKKPSSEDIVSDSE